MGRSKRRKACRNGRLLTIWLTLAWRVRMIEGSISGASIQRRRQRAPMAVRVRSIAQSSEPWNWLSRWVAVSSRLRRVWASSTSASPGKQVIGRSKGGGVMPSSSKGQVSPR